MPWYSNPARCARLRSSRFRVSTSEFGHLFGDLVEVDPLELVPLGEHHQQFGALARGIDGGRRPR